MLFRSVRRHGVADVAAPFPEGVGEPVADQQGRGCGKALLRLLLEEARRMGITEELLVTVQPDNTASRRVAEACGGEKRRETAERVYYWFS